MGRFERRSLSLKGESEPIDVLVVSAIANW
jgi:hypothetical protein